LAVVDPTSMRASSVDQRCLLSDMHGDVKAARFPTSGPDSVQASYAYQLPASHGRTYLLISTASSDRMDRAVSTVSRGASYAYELPVPSVRTELLLSTASSDLMDRAVSTVKRVFRFGYIWRRQGGKIGSRRLYPDENELC
jgi:hypothetical protein